jgi:WD40 repeat protein
MAYILQLVPLLTTNCCASASSDQADSIRIFDLQRTDKPTVELEYSEELGRVSQLQTQHQHSLLIGCFSSSSTVLGWDLRSAEHRPSLELTGHSSTPFLSLGHSAGSVIAAGASNDDDSSSGQIELFDLRRGTKPYCLYDQAHSDSITSLEFNPSGSDHHLLSASTDGLLVLHDTRIADQEESILLTSNTGASLAHARWQPDGRTIWAGSDMETLSRWDADQVCRLQIESRGKRRITGADYSLFSSKKKTVVSPQGLR